MKKLVELLDEAEEWANHKCDELDCETCPAMKMRGNCFQQLMVGRLIANGVTVQEWISVADKIPPDQEEVLVLTQSKNGVRNVDKGYWAIDHFIHRGRSEVTHWMPMPNPPKGE